MISTLEPDEVEKLERELGGRVAGFLAGPANAAWVESMEANADAGIANFLRIGLQQRFPLGGDKKEPGASVKGDYLNKEGQFVATPSAYTDRDEQFVSALQRVFEGERGEKLALAYLGERWAHFEMLQTKYIIRKINSEKVKPEWKSFNGAVRLRRKTGIAGSYYERVLGPPNADGLILLSGGYRGDHYPQSTWSSEMAVNIIGIQIHEFRPDKFVGLLNVRDVKGTLEKIEKISRTAANQQDMRLAPAELEGFSGVADEAFGKDDNGTGGAIYTKRDGIEGLVGYVQVDLLGAFRSSSASSSSSST